MANDSVRQRKVADKVKEQVSLIIDHKVKDPDRGFITVTYVKMSPDLRIASIYFTVLGDEADIERSLKALERARNFIRSELGPYLKMRFVPELRFFPDDTYAYAQRIEKLLQTIKKNENDE